MIKIRTAILLVITSLILLGLSSCNPTKRLQKKCDKWTTLCTPESQIDTIFKSDTVIFRDTIISYQLERDTVRISKLIKIPAHINIDTIEKLKGIIGIRAGVKENLLWAEGFINDSTVFIKLHNALKEIKTLRSEKHSKTIIKKEVRNSSFANFTTWFFWILLIIAVIYLLLRFLKNYLKRF